MAESVEEEFVIYYRMLNPIFLENAQLEIKVSVMGGLLAVALRRYGNRILNFSMQRIHPFHKTSTTASSYTDIHFKATPTTFQPVLRSNWRICKNATQSQSSRSQVCSGASRGEKIHLTLSEAVVWEKSKVKKD